MADHVPGELLNLWERHRDTGWPPGSGVSEGELMTLDTVISGCMVYYLDTPEGLDPQRVDMLASCLAELDVLLPDLTDEAGDYFGRLRRLGFLLLETSRRP